MILQWFFLLVTTEYGIIWFFSFLFCFLMSSFKREQQPARNKDWRERVENGWCSFWCIKKHILPVGLSLSYHRHLMTSPVYDDISKGIIEECVGATMILEINLCLFQHNKNYSNEKINADSMKKHNVANCIFSQF